MQCLKARLWSMERKESVENFLDSTVWSFVHNHSQTTKQGHSHYRVGSLQPTRITQACVQHSGMMYNSGVLRDERLAVSHIISMQYYVCSFSQLSNQSEGTRSKLHKNTVKTEERNSRTLSDISTAQNPVKSSGFSPKIWFSCQICSNSCKLSVK